MHECVLRLAQPSRDATPRDKDARMAAVTRSRPRRARQLAAELATEAVLDAGFAIGSWPRAACGRGACSRGAARDAVGNWSRRSQPRWSSTRASQSAAGRERQLAAGRASEVSPAP